MFKKISNSLFSPKEVSKYYNESFGKTILFFIVMLIILILITFVSMLTTSALTESMKKEIKKSFLKEDIAFVIDNGELHNVNNDSEYVYINKAYETLYIGFTENVENCESPIDGISIVFAKDGIYIKLPVAIQLFGYDKYDYLKNIDFTDKDLLADINFWDNMYSIADSELNELKPTFLIINTIRYIFSYIGLMMTIVLIVSLFTKLRTGTYLNFGAIFKITIYSLAPLVVCLVFSTLFNLGFLTYIGYILSMVYNSITINEVLKKLYLNRNEGE